jgi:hypothetical protein
MTILGPCGILMKFYFADQFCAVVRLLELSPEHPYQAVLDSLVRLHGPVVSITEVEKPPKTPSGAAAKIPQAQEPIDLTPKIREQLVQAAHFLAKGATA